MIVRCVGKNRLKSKRKDIKLTLHVCCTCLRWKVLKRDRTAEANFDVTIYDDALTNSRMCAATLRAQSKNFQYLQNSTNREARGSTN